MSITCPAKTNNSLEAVRALVNYTPTRGIGRTLNGETLIGGNLIGVGR